MFAVWKKTMLDKKTCRFQFLWTNARAAATAATVVNDFRSVGSACHATTMHGASARGREDLFLEVARLIGPYLSYLLNAPRFARRTQYLPDSLDNSSASSLPFSHSLSPSLSFAQSRLGGSQARTHVYTRKPVRLPFSLSRFRYLRLTYTDQPSSRTSLARSSCLSSLLHNRDFPMITWAIWPAPAPYSARLRRRTVMSSWGEPRVESRCPFSLRTLSQPASQPTERYERVAVATRLISYKPYEE